MAAAIKDGAVVPTKSEFSKRCNATTNSGVQCKAFAIQEKETCFYHSLTPAERLAAARRGGLTTSARRREKKAGNPRSGLVSHVRLEDVLRTCVDGMTATYEDAGLPQEKDWDARLLSLIVLLSIFGKQYRSRPDEAAALLLKVLPQKVSPTDDEAEMQRQIQAGYERGREAWRQERAGVAAIRGLYLDAEYPRDFVAPWEDRDALNKELAAFMEAQEKRLEGVEVTAVYTAV